jgi:creatinine amidohydrolase
VRETSRDIAPGRRIVVVPLGSVEQHGPHLPLDTDTRIAVALATAGTERAGTDVFLLAPALAYSASDEHASFPGTLSIGTEVTAGMLRALSRSAWWAAGMVIVNGHGGNIDALGLVGDTGAPRRSWSPRLPPGGDLHAGRTETSLGLHLFPSDVRLEAAEVGALAADPMDAVARMRADGVAAVSANGVLGDPTGASAQEGARMFAGMVDDLVAVLEECRRTWIGPAG